jgi:hypothetical protein
MKGFSLSHVGRLGINMMKKYVYFLQVWPKIMILIHDLINKKISILGRITSSSKRYSYDKHRTLHWYDN